MPLQDTIDRAADLIAAGDPRSTALTAGREPGEPPPVWPAEARRIVMAALPGDVISALELGYRLGYAVAQRDGRARGIKSPDNPHNPRIIPI